MPRRRKTYVIVSPSDTTTSLTVEEHDDVEKLKAALAEAPDGSLLLAGELIEFTVDTSPRVVLGEPKPRVRKPAAERKPRKAKNGSNGAREFVAPVEAEA